MSFGGSKQHKVINVPHVSFAPQFIFDKMVEGRCRPDGLYCLAALQGYTGRNAGQLKRRTPRSRNRAEAGQKQSFALYWAKRNPLLLLVLVALFLLRFATRQFLVLLFHEPPRNTRRASRRAFPPRLPKDKKICLFRKNSADAEDKIEKG